MKNRSQMLHFATRHGAMLPLVAVCMIILIVCAVFSIDIAYMHMVRAELRTATDAAARAGAETLNRTQDESLAIDAALAVAERNTVSGDGLILRRDQVVVGGVAIDGDGRFTFDENSDTLTSVRVTGLRTADSEQRAVPLLLGPLLGKTTFQPQQIATASASVRDIALVLDRSGSMRSRDAGGGLTRNQALINAVVSFIDQVEASSPNSNISLTTYSTSSSRDLPLTNNLNSVRSAVRRLPASGATNIFQGLRQGSDSLDQDRLRRINAARTIVLMTDGQFNVGGTPVPSANIAAGRGQTVHTVTFSRGANQRIMQDVARIGGGLHFHADDAEDLEEAFREIANTLSVLLVE